jgi:hypothetical protein
MTGAVVRLESYGERVSRRPDDGLGRHAVAVIAFGAAVLARKTSPKYAARRPRSRREAVSTFPDSRRSKLSVQP